jgi:hypothetical protein
MGLYIIKRFIRSAIFLLGCTLNKPTPGQGNKEDIENRGIFWQVLTKYSFCFTFKEKLFKALQKRYKAIKQK